MGSVSISMASIYAVESQDGNIFIIGSLTSGDLAIGTLNISSLTITITKIESHEEVIKKVVAGDLKISLAAIS